MKRTYRLRRPAQFWRTRREGRTFSSPLLLLNALPNRRRTTRCGFVVSKQIGGAVQRNRAKRRTREAVRLAYPAIASGYDLVFVVRDPRLISAPFPEIQATVERLLRLAELWRQPSPLPHEE